MQKKWIGVVLAVVLALGNPMTLYATQTEVDNTQGDEGVAYKQMKGEDFYE